MNNKSTEIGFAGLLTIAFIVLKLCGVIKWSWVWVMSPTWISLAIGAIVWISVVVIGVAKMKKADKDR